MSDADSGKSVGIKISRAQVTVGAGEALPLFRFRREPACFDADGRFIQFVQPRALSAVGLAIFHSIGVRLFGQINDIAVWRETREGGDIRQDIAQVGHRNPHWKMGRLLLMR
jgi:hypothetical protein